MGELMMDQRFGVRSDGAVVGVTTDRKAMYIEGMSFSPMEGR